MSPFKEPTPLFQFIYCGDLQADLQVVERRGVLQHDPLVNCSVVLFLVTSHSIKASGVEPKADQLTSDQKTNA